MGGKVKLVLKIKEVRDDSQSWIKDMADRCPLHVGHSNLEGEGKERGMALTITTSGGQNMTIPLTQKLRMETRLTR